MRTRPARRASRPTRRDVLRAVGAGSLAGLAGCIGDDGGSNGEGRPDWPHPYYSARGTSYNPRASGPESKPGEAWGVEVGFQLGRPVVYEDTVYFASNKQLRAFAVDDGTERWSVEAESKSGFRSAPTADGEYVYVGQTGERTGVIAYTHDGEEAWHAPTVSSIWSPIVRPEPDRDYLYAADTDGYLFKVRTADGSVEWRTRVFGPVRSLAAIGGQPVVGTEGGEVYAFLDEGTEQGPTGLWRTKLPGGIQALALYSSSDVIAGMFGAGVARLRGGLRAGSIGWHREESSPHGSVVVGPDQVFSTDGSGLHAYDVRSGDPSWKTDGDFFAPPAAAGDTIYVADTSDDGGVVAFDLAGGVGLGDTRLGNRRWRYSLTGGALTGATPAHDSLFVVEDGGEDAPSRLVALRRE